MTEYSDMVKALAKPGEDIAKEITPEQAHLLHMAVGIAGEAGELLDAIKKHVVYQKELDLENVIEELGDLEFYMEGLRQGVAVSRDETLTNNYNKLSCRYHSGAYSNQQAQDRADKVVVDPDEEPKTDF